MAGNRKRPESGKASRRKNVGAHSLRRCSSSLVSLSSSRGEFSHLSVPSSTPASPQTPSPTEPEWKR